MSGDSSGRELEILPGSEVNVGRKRDLNQLSCNDGFMSRRHFKMWATDEMLVIQDTGSSHGTLVNETPISGPVSLRDGDQIRAGATDFRVELTFGAVAGNDYVDDDATSAGVAAAAAAAVTDDDPEFPFDVPDDDGEQNFHADIGEDALDDNWGEAPGIKSDAFAFEADVTELSPGDEFEPAAEANLGPQPVPEPEAAASFEAAMESDEFNPFADDEPEATFSEETASEPIAAVEDEPAQPVAEPMAKAPKAESDDFNPFADDEPEALFADEPEAKPAVEKTAEPLTVADAEPLTEMTTEIDSDDFNPFADEEPFAVADEPAAEPVAELAPEPEPAADFADNPETEFASAFQDDDAPAKEVAAETEFEAEDDEEEFEFEEISLTPDEPPPAAKGAPATVVEESGSFGDAFLEDEEEEEAPAAADSLESVEETLDEPITPPAAKAPKDEEGDEFGLDFGASNEEEGDFELPFGEWEDGDEGSKSASNSDSGRKGGGEMEWWEES